MVLNYIWISFFLLSFVVALIKLFYLGDTNVFVEMVDSIFDNAKLGFELSLGLTGVMALWLGLMKIGEEGGIIKILSKLIGPFFYKLFPGIPKNSNAIGSIIMNFSANILGLDNAATPLGLKAMQEMQEVNPNKDTASDAQIMFLVLNTSGLSIVPISILADRSLLGSAHPTSVFLPILLSTFCSTVIGLIIVSIYQKINLWNKVVVLYLMLSVLLVFSLTYYLSTLGKQELNDYSLLISNFIIFFIIISFILLGLFKKLDLYKTFVNGAKEGFEISIKIIPYLIAILIAIGVFRTSGTMDYLLNFIKQIAIVLNFDTRIIDALPVALFKPLSGGAARAMMIETIEVHGVDSFVGKMSSIFRGATETTFYILAVYFGSVKIKNIRYAITAGLVADIAGIIAAIIIGYLFFG